jgi:predicted nucleotidyltransferase
MKLKYTKNELLKFLSNLDKNLNSNIEIVVIGGSAMSLLGLSEATKDVDLFFKDINYDGFTETLKTLSNNYNLNEIEYWENGKLILHKEGSIIELKLPDDYYVIAKKLNTSFKHITLKILDPIDLILTKANRCNRRDIEDIKEICKKYNLSLKKLKTRFKIYLKNYSGSKENYKSNFNFICELLIDEKLVSDKAQNSF